MEKVFLTPSSVLSKYRADARVGRRHQRAILSKAALPLPLPLPFKAFLPPPPSHSFTHHSCPTPSCASPSELILLGSTNLEQKLVLPPFLSKTWIAIPSFTPSYRHRNTNKPIPFLLIEPVLSRDMLISIPFRCTHRRRRGGRGGGKAEMANWRSPCVMWIRTGEAT